MSGMDSYIASLIGINKNMRDIFLFKNNFLKHNTLKLVIKNFVEINNNDFNGSYVEVNNDN